MVFESRNSRAVACKKRQERDQPMSSKFSKLIFSFFLCSSLVVVHADAQAAQVDTSQLQKQCQNITQQQRQMAKAAGYDVDAACKSLKSSQSSASTLQEDNPATVLPRGTQLETSERGVIGELEPSSLDTEDEQATRKAQTNHYTSDELKRYGYDLFAGVPTTFAPATDIPIPVDYIVGPGDSVQIQLLGKTSDTYQLSVERDGAINFPELGPISVSGLKFSEAKELIQQRVSEQMIGVRAVISLGELRSIKVFVLGEAFKPGSYTVSSLSTMTNALFVSGGVTDIGSLRNIQLKRRGKIITRLDLYDLLLKGDTKNDARLLPGDVIYIPPVGNTVGIKGEVKRPAIYELKGKLSLKALIKLAGGYSANAFPNMTQITRKNTSGFTTVIDYDFSRTKMKNISLNNGDIIEISTVLEELENVVRLSGAFQRARAINWHKNLKLSDVIHSIKDFKQNTDLNIGLIVRREKPLMKVSVISFNLQGILEKKLSADIALIPMDEVMVFARGEKEDDELKERFVAKGILDQQIMAGHRDEMLEPVINSLMGQTSDGGLIKIVDINGNVRYPGQYPLTNDMSVRDLVLLAGGLKEASYLGNAEITRRDLTDKEKATIEHFRINLTDQLMGVDSAVLQARDKLSIHSTPEFRDELAIVIKGEVRFPGRYEFKRGETLSQVIVRAGGFTEMAHVDASVFTREDLKIQEAKQLKELQNRMREDIAASQLEDAAAGESSALKDSEGLLEALSDTKALGRLVIQLTAITTGTSDDIQLKDGDQLVIPTFRQEVSVLGEVQHGTSHIYNQQWTLDDYLEKSGGLTNRADDDRIYVVKADGSVFLPNQSGWLSHQNENLSPGDTIVVPLDTDRIKSLALWTSVSQIVYQLTLGVAAVNSL